MTFTNSIKFNIDKLVGELKTEEELKEVLKRKFTKKEFKVFVAMEDEKPVSEIAEMIKDEENRVQKLYESACKKLNNEHFKKELVNV